MLLYRRHNTAIWFLQIYTVRLLNNTTIHRYVILDGFSLLLGLFSRKQEFWAVSQFLTPALQVGLILLRFSLLFVDRCKLCGHGLSRTETVVRAGEHLYHVHCFTCTKCDQQLQGQQYYECEGRPLCEDCYQVSLGNCRCLVVLQQLQVWLGHSVLKCGPSHQSIMMLPDWWHGLPSSRVGITLNITNILSNML